MQKRNLSIITLIVLAIGFLCPNCLGEITAPKRIDAGELAVVKSTVKATWAVYPLEYSSSFYVADDGTTLLFASPIEGKITFFAASVDDEGTAKIESKLLYNGIDPEEETDEQEDEKPVETTLESIVKTTKVEGVSQEDYSTLADSFQSVINGIERGTVRTPAGAREAFRGQWAYRAGQSNPAILNAFSGLITALSEKINFDSLESVKADFEIVVKALREVKVQSAPEKKTPAKSNQTQTQGNCPNGQCPANGNGYYRWGY